MAFAEPRNRSEPTHAVRTRSRPGIKDWDAEGAIAVENRVVDVAVDYGSAVHLCLDRSLLADTTPDRLSMARERLDRLGDARRILRNEYPEYRARLPEDADRVGSCLAIEAGETDDWLARLHGVVEFSVVSPDSWLYRSIPHHAHVRELNVDSAEGFLEAVAAELEPIRGTGVVPAGTLVSWTDDEFQYELVWNALRRRKRGRESDPWTVFDLKRLRSVYPAPERAELGFRWLSRTSGTDSAIRRAFASAVDRLSTDPPTRVGVSDPGTVDEITAALRELRTQVDYEFAIDDRRSTA